MRSTIRLIFTAAAALLVAGAASAAGLHTHFLMVQKAIPELRTPALKTLLENNERAVMCGVSFPDFGTAIRYASLQQVEVDFGSVAHHQAFAEAYFDHVMAKCGANLAGCDPLIAHYLGAAAHGMMDDLYDQIFMARAEATDAAGGDGNHDIGADTILIFKYQPVYVPPVYWMPTKDLAEVYRSMGVSVRESDLRGGRVWHQVAATGERGVFLLAYPARTRDMAFTRDHLITADGGVDYVGRVTANYWEALWRRLHGQADQEMVLETWPREGSQKMAAQAGAPMCRVLAYFTTGMDAATLTPDTFFITGPAGPVKAEVKFKDKEGVVVLLPNEDLTPGATYTATLAAGIMDLRGNAMGKDYSWSFQPR